MSDLPIGKLHDKPYGRDAIHIAVIQVVAAEELKPGDHVCLTKNSGTPPTVKAWYSDEDLEPIGIVDPFISKDAIIYKGTIFFLFLYPKTVTSLRHHWTHPAFRDEGAEIKLSEEKQKALSWLEDFAIEADLTLEALLEGAEDYVKNGNYLCEGDKWDSFDFEEEFWEHYKTYTGKPPKEGSFFSCSC